MQSTAIALRAFCDAFPELSDELQGALATRLPGVLRGPHADTRAQLEQIGSAAGGLSLEVVARLVAKVGVDTKQ